MDVELLTLSRILGIKMPLLQMTFENIVTKGAIAHNEIFLIVVKILSDLFNKNTPTYSNFSHVLFVKLISISSAANMVYGEKG